MSVRNKIYQSEQTSSLIAVNYSKIKKMKSFSNPVSVWLSLTIHFRLAQQQKFQKNKSVSKTNPIFGGQHRDFFFVHSILTKFVLFKKRNKYSSEESIVFVVFSSHVAKLFCRYESNRTDVNVPHVIRNCLSWVPNTHNRIASFSTLFTNLIHETWT